MIDFFEFSNELLCLANQQGCFTRVNPAWTRTFGWTAEELTSRPYLEFVHPEDIAATLREAELLRKPGHETIWFENRYRCRDGGYRWLAWRVSVVPDAQQLIASARDITDLKLQTAALQEAEERFRSLALQAPVGIAQSDAEGRTFFVNDKWCEIAGINPQEAMGFGWMNALHPDDRDRMIAEWLEAMAAGRPYSTSEFRFVHKDGAMRWASGTAALIKAADGTPIGQIGCMQDITERKAVQDALRESEERFRAFMKNTPTLAWAKDEHGKILFLNRAGEEMFHFPNREAWYGKTDADFWPPEVAQRFRENDRQVLESGLPLTRVEESVSASGNEYHWMTILFPYTDLAQRRFVGGIAMEITKLKRAEDALRHEQELLRSLIDVQEEEKQHLCHEFHDGLIQYAYGAMMALEGRANDPRYAADKPWLESVVENLRKGIEDGRQTIRGIRPAVLDEATLEAALEDLIDQFKSTGIMITIKYQGTIGVLPNSLQTAVYRVAQEALNNAKKYSETDVVRIVIAREGDELKLEIRDFGVGFDVAPAKKRGFGLRGMTERVRLLGGECKIESTLGEGTRITARLPIAPEPTSPAR